MEYFGVKKVDLPNGETYAYRETGTGEKVLVLLHGNMSSSLFYDKLASLIEGSFRVISVDMRGFGYSSYNKTCSGGLDDWAEDIYLLLKELKIEKASLMGWSTGGGVSLKLASKHPEVTDKLIMLSTVGMKGIKFPVDADKPTLEDMKEKWLPGQLTEKAEREGDTEYLESRYKAVVYTSGRYPDPETMKIYMKEACLQRSYWETLYGLMTFNISDENNGLTDGTGEYKKIKNDILILNGDCDKITKVEGAEEMAKVFGSQATLKIFPGGDHSLLTYDLENLAKYVLEFMSTN